MHSTKTGSPKASGPGGTKELVPVKNCSDVEEVAEDSDGDDPDQIVETSQNERWQKINTTVRGVVASCWPKRAEGIFLFNAHLLQVTRNVPGIDSAHLAMDTEEGVEVVWNEVCYSNRKVMKGTKVPVTVPAGHWHDIIILLVCLSVFRRVW